MSSPINVGVIGCGYWGPNLVRNFKALTSCRLKAICDVNESRLRHLRTLYTDMDAHTDATTLLNDPDVHASRSQPRSLIIITWPKPAYWRGSTRWWKNRSPRLRQNVKS